MSKRKSTKRIWLFVSLMITTTLAVPAAYIWTPDVQRWVQLNRLTSDDVSLREKALNYVIRRAPVDDRVMQGVFEQLDNADDPTFQQLVNALDIAGLWSNPPVPHDIWLRWVDMLASHEDIEIRIKAAQLLTDRSEFASYERCARTLERLVKDSSDEVRYNALFAAAELASASQRIDKLKHLVVQAQLDENPIIASDAILLAAFLDEAADATLLRHDSILVQRSAIYSRVAAGQLQAKAICDLTTDPTANPIIRDFAIFCLSFYEEEHAQRCADNLIQSINPQELSEDNLRSLWRAILSRPTTDKSSKEAFGIILGKWVSDRNNRNNENPLIPRIIVPVMIYRSASMSNSKTHVMHHGDLSQLDDLAFIALLESPEAGRMWLGEEKPALFENKSSLIAIRTAIHENNIEEMCELMSSESATLRDLFCKYASIKLSERQQTDVIQRLLNDFNDNAKMSGAILAGMTGLESGLLKKKMAAEDIWKVRQVHRLAVWMQDGKVIDDGKEINMPDAVVGYLSRDDMPASTVLLAMLHRDRQRAFEVLFNPKAIDLNLSSNAIRIGSEADAISLHELLVDGRWWHVLEPHLPADAPRLWLWGDEQLQQFQLDLMRFWYVTHKFQLTE